MSGGDWKDLLAASQKGEIELVKYHIRNDINPNYQHPEAMTAPLLESIKFGHLEISKYLLENGANPAIVEDFGTDTPMIIAERQKDQDAIDLLNSYLHNFKLKPITYRDGTTNKAFVFTGNPEKETTFLMLPALGVWAKYYLPLNKKLHEKGFNVISIDWRGNGHSSERPSRENDWGYETILQDINEVFDFAERQFPNTKKVLLGHSLGGQIGCLFASRFPKKIDSIILTACCSVHYTGYTTWSEQTKVKFVSRFFPLASKLFGYFPGKKIGFGGTEARTLMRDWGHNGLTGKYELIDSNFDYETALKNTSKPLLAISIKDDWLAPKEATKNLYQKFNSDAPIEHIVISKEDAKVESLNHFNWAKQPDFLVEKMMEWLLK